MTPSEITRPATPASVRLYPIVLPASAISPSARTAQMSIPTHATTARIR